MTDNLGADAVIGVNAGKTVQTDMQLLRRRAKVVLVGLFGGELSLNLVEMPTKALRLIGSYTGSLKDMILPFLAIIIYGIVIVGSTLEPEMYSICYSWLPYLCQLDPYCFS